MKKFIFTWVFVFLACVVTNAQNNYDGYYYSGGLPRYWTTDSTSIILILKCDTIFFNSVTQNILSIFNDEKDEVFYGNEDDNIIINSLRIPSFSQSQLINNITNGHSDSIVFFSYSKRLNGQQIWFRNEVMIKFKENHDTSDIHTIMSDYIIDSVEKEDDLEYNFICSSENDVVSLANRIYESGFVDFSTPDYYGEYHLNYSDPLYPLQYYLKNTGQIIPNEQSNTDFGVVGMDIKAEETWSFVQSILGTIGTDNKIAVLDDGVENHEDLKNNANHSRVLLGYTPNRIDCGHPIRMSMHGQSCSGIIAASHNNIGIAGVAPQSLIVPIRIFKINRDRESSHIIPITAFSFKAIARAVKHSWNNLGCDILNFSNGATISCSEMNDKYRKSISDAALRGRNNKGCVIVAASGNKSMSDIIDFPANHQDVISVGAIDKSGHRGCYSNYSEDLSVVAFGGSYYCPSQISYTDIRTIDREGNKGYSGGNYYDYFGQTSAAAPMVSGVASLMLSVNPNLTSQQVKNIIEQTAQKLPDYTFAPANTIHPNGSWNEQVGYGLVDAHKAVVQAYMFGHSISVSGQQLPELYQQYTYNCNIYRPDLFTFVWSSVNGKFSIESSNGTEVIIRPVSTGVDSVIVCIYNQGRLMFREGIPITVTDPCSIGNLNPVGTGDFHVVNNTTWYGNNRLLPGEAMVDSLATLTITGTLHCSSSARIIVRPGGKLVVDGGTLTSACAGEMWQGIILEGHTSLPQTAACQGTVQLLNGATIENALCGILTCNPADSLHTTGGIITADSATFRNCAKAVEYLSYADTTCPGYIADNKGSFTNCTFTVDDNNLFAANNTDFLAHVTMWDVKGVRFTHCRFEDVRTQNHTRKSAISTIDAGFKIKNGCDYTLPLSNPDCNCYLTTNTYCSFSGFGTAISAATSGNPYAVTIDGARFIDNVTGVGISGNSHAEVTRCIFHLDSIIPDYRSVTGLSLSGCTGYLVEENTFTRVATSPSGNRYGIQVVASGTDMNSLYRNTFERLTRGITVSGINGDGDSHTGLQMTCNGFTSNTYDMYIASGATVCDNQGSTSKGADNTFSGTQTSSLYSAGSQSLTYHHSAGSSHAPYNPTTNYVTVNGTAGSNMCGSTICGIQPDIPTPPPVPKSPTPGFLSLKEQYNNLMADFNRNGYAEVLEHADDNTYDAATIVAAENAAQQISAIAAELYAQSHAAVRALISDTLEDVQAVHAWLDATPGLASRYLAAETGFVAGADAVETHGRASLQDIAAHLTTAAERAEYDNYVAFHALKEALEYGNGHVAWPHATDAQVWELVRIADANTGRSSLLAKNVLCFFFGICYDDDMETRALATTTIPPQAEPQTLTGQQKITVHPNPAHDVLRVSVTDGEIARIEMFDAFGRVIPVETQNFASLPSPTTTVTTSDIPSGVYVLRVTLTDGTVRTTKIVKR